MPISGGSGGGGSGGAVVQLGTATVSGSPGTLDISSISASYNDLVVVVIARCTNAAVTDNIIARFNNDSGGNYYAELSTITGATSISGTEVLAATAARLADSAPAASAASGTYAMFELQIPGYSNSGTWFRTWQTVDHAPTSTSTGLIHTGISGGWWNSTTAVNRITVFGSATANLAVGSTMRVYGRL